MTHSPAVIAAFFAWCVLASPAHGTIVRELPLAELFQSADVVVLGHPVTSTSYWREGRIYTKTTFVISETWTGAIPSTSRSMTPLGESIAVVTPGGIIGDIGQRVLGVAALPALQRTVLCLRHRGNDHAYAIVGMAFGVFYVDDTGPLTDPPVYRIVNEIRIAPSTTPTISASRDPSPPPATLTTLRHAVQEATHAR